MIALILAGGYGKRLRPYTDTLPKPMIEVGGKPILEWQIEWLKSHGFRNFILLIGHLGSKIQEYFGDGREWGVSIKYSAEDRPLGTAGAVKRAEKLIAEEEFLLVNGDIITNLNPLELKEEMDENILGVISLSPLKSPFGIVEVNERGFIVNFREKPIIEGIWINAGVIYFSRSALKYFPELGNYETEVLPRLAEEKKLKGKKYNSIYWKSIDSHKDLEEADEALRKGEVKY